MRTDTMNLGGRRTGPSLEGAGLVTLFAPTPAEVPSAVAVSDAGLILGRDPPPGGLRLPFTSVSRVHVRVIRRGDALFVEDLESRNGAFVNGRAIKSSALEHGDELRVGEVLFKTVTAEVDGYARFPLEGVVPPAPNERLRGGYVMSAIHDQVVKAGRGPFSVLVTGETGTGKELVADALHKASGRPGNLCAVNCAAIPASLLESELFGYKRGAFTGADSDRLGIVRSAHKGTLFLDEIGDMPLEAQAKLLRLLETRQVTPLGSHKSEQVDVRVVCATHRSLPKMVREERFRADLYARINGCTIQLPPLRDRKEDVYQLARFFLDSNAGASLVVRPAFMLGLCSHDWPFNIRELFSAIQRAVSMSEGTLDTAHLPPDVALALEHGPAPQESSGAVGPAAPGPRMDSSAAPSLEALRELLGRHEGNVTAVARELKKDRTQIHRWMKRFGISPEDFRS